jgi:uncharacterized protein YjbI with pentapeptide repeats
MTTGRAGSRASFNEACSDNSIFRKAKFGESNFSEASFGKANSSASIYGKASLRNARVIPLRWPPRQAITER